VYGRIEISFDTSRITADRVKTIAQDSFEMLGYKLIDETEERCQAPFDPLTRTILRALKKVTLRKIISGKSFFFCGTMRRHG